MYICMFYRIESAVSFCMSREGMLALFSHPSRWSITARSMRAGHTVRLLSSLSIPCAHAVCRSNSSSSTGTQGTGEQIGVTVASCSALHRTQVCLSSHPVSSSPSSSTCAVPSEVSSELTSTLRQLLLRQRHETPLADGLAARLDEWKPVTALYHALPITLRREHVRPHRTLAHVLQKLRHVLSIELDSAALHYRLSPRAPDAAHADDYGHGAVHTGSTFSSSTSSTSSSTCASSRVAECASIVQAANTSPSTPSGVSPLLSAHANVPNSSTDNLLLSKVNTGAATDGKSHAIHAMTNTHGSRHHEDEDGRSSSHAGDAVRAIANASSMPPVDFYYRVALHDIPPPPPDFDVTPSALRGAQVSDDGAVVALADLVPHIPPFFVPMREVLSYMPGYTEEHLQRYLLGKAMEAVEVLGVRYVRLHGGGGADMIRLEGCEEAEATFARYRPDVSLLPRFIAAFAGCVDTWLPLRLLLSRVSAEVVARLPFEGPAAIIYFAQMQHVFAFSLDPASVAAPDSSRSGFANTSHSDSNSDDRRRGSRDDDEDSERGTGAGYTHDQPDGATSSGAHAAGTAHSQDAHLSHTSQPQRPHRSCGLLTDSTAVLLRSPGYGGLDVHTTPVPKSCNYMLDAIAAEATVDVEHVRRTLRGDIHDELVSYFGDILAFFRAHGPLFHLSQDSTVVMRTRYFERRYLASLPLEEQLALAVRQRDRRRMRLLRRRLALRDNPAHPLHDRDNLARELSRHLPRKGIVSLRHFCKSLPDEVGSFLPAKRGNFFEGYPQYFQLFEYQQPGMWYLAHPEQPLPRGVIRQHFTESELVKMMAAFLQSRESALCSLVMFNLPRGAQETVRRRYGGAYYLMEKYPRFFGMVIGGSGGNTANSAQVSLIEVPTEATLTEAMRENDVKSDAKEDESGEGQQ